MILRDLKHELLNMAKAMPIIAVTGPRQSGKTTLVKATFPEYNYVNLEDLESRAFARSDPKGFLANYPDNLIIDEVQYVPQLFSYIQVIVDEKQQNGLFILTGSYNFLLLEKVSQSLAGRVAIYNLLPFSMRELKDTRHVLNTYEDYIFKGFYPRIYDQNLFPEKWLSSYVRTYLERDVRQIVNIGDLTNFQGFLKLCAGRTGQLINLSSIANELGVSYQTIKRWLSVLEASFIIFRLQPFYRNFNKRIIKSTKLYFYDPGLAAYLLGIRSPEQVYTHYLKGELFETLILSEIKKQYFNAGIEAPIYFWRDSRGNEVDCIIELGTKLLALEMKSGKTINQSFFSGLKYWQDLSNSDKNDSYLIYGGSEHQVRSDARVLGWNQLSFPLKYWP